MAYMANTNLYNHVKITHKRALKDVLKEQGRVFVYSANGAKIVGISGIEVRNVGPSNPRKSKCPKDRMIL